MKKLMIIAAVAMAAVSVNAAQYVWKTATSKGKVYEAGSTTDTYNGTAYLFGDYKTVETIFAALAKGDDIADLASLDNNTISSGVISAKDGQTQAITYDGNFSGFIAIVATDGSFYIGTEATANDPGQGAATINVKATESSQLAAKMASDGYKGAGWYTTVPEPTSGLLLLLGVAGLALRRRRA